MAQQSLPVRTYATAGAVVIDSGGKHVLVHDDQGQTLVLQPGPKYRELAKNLLVEYDKRGMQPEVQSNFYFEGRRIYFRTRGFLYCIGEK